MRLGAPHKIDRYANRCSLYPPPAAVAYVARQREPLFVSNLEFDISRKLLYTRKFPRQEQASALRRRRLLRIVRNSFWLSLTRYATSPFPQKSRSARLLGCKRPPDGSLSLPIFADFGQPQGLSLRYDIN